MKTIPRHLKAIPLVLLSVLTAPLIHAQSSGAISVDRSIHYAQTDASTVTAQQTPYSFIFHVRGGSVNMANWGPAFYKPGSGGVPQSGASSATNTGTLNFPAMANNGTDYMFIHEFETDAAMQSFYPLAPTDGGAYGVKFLGSSAPTPAIFTDGLVYPTTTTYPVTTPQVVSANNGAVWSNGKLVLQATGITTLNLNTFTEYSSTTYGSLIAVGIFNASGAVVAGSESYYLPVGDSTENPEPIVQPAITSINVAGASLVPGQTYTLEIQYTVIAGRPEEANLNGTEFQGVSSYRRVVSVSIAVDGIVNPSADFNADGKSDIIWRNPSTGEVIIALMNGASEISRTTIGNDPDWDVRGTGDFNNDGKSDILWRQISTGRVIVWLMNGTTRASYTDISTAPDWQVFGSGDFNSDGQSDIIWRQISTGRVIFWLMNGTTRASYTDVNTDLDWEVSGSGDFNNDGQSDLLWRQISTGRVIVWLMNGTTRASYTDISTAPGWEVRGSGDFNNDGKSDILWREISTGRVIVWLMNGTTRASYADIATEPQRQVTNY